MQILFLFVNGFYKHPTFCRLLIQKEVKCERNLGYNHYANADKRGRLWQQNDKKRVVAE